MIIKEEMKITIKYLSLIFSPVVFVSCSLSLGGMVALDNSLSADSKEINLNKLSELKADSEIILELTDSAIVQGEFEGIEYTTIDNTQKTVIKLSNNDSNIQYIDIKEINRCTKINEDGSIWTAVAIGATIDAIIIYLASTSNGGFGGSPIFH